jgi:hypothetical protein
VSQTFTAYRFGQAAAIIRAVPTTAGRRIGIVVVLVLLVGAGALATLPLGAGAMRIGSLSLLWWYAAVVAPLVAAAVTSRVLFRRLPPADHGSPAAPPT